MVIRKHWLVFAGVSVVWGSSWIASDALNAYVPALLAAAVRFLLAFLVLLAFVLAKGYRLPRRQPLGSLLLLSVTMIVLPTLLLFWARQLLPSATVAVLFTAMPLLAVGLTPAFAGAPVPRGAMYGAIVGWGGMILALGATFFLAQAAGAAIVLLAVAMTGASLVWSRRILLGIHPAVAATVLLGAAAPCFAVASACLERGQTAQWNIHAMAALVFLALVPGALAYSAWLWLLQRLEAYQLATVQWLEPLVALAEGSILLRAGFTWTMLSGCLITCAALWMVLRARLEDDQTVSLWAKY